MEPFDNCSYVVECTPDGTYYAYLLDYRQCCAYGETEEEALDNLADVAEDFSVRLVPYITWKILLDFRRVVYI